MFYTPGCDLKALRKHLGLNQSVFWSPLNVTQSGGSRYEGDRNIPAPVQTLLTIRYGSDAAANAAFLTLRPAKDAPAKITKITKGKKAA